MARTLSLTLRTTGARWCGTRCPHSASGAQPRELLASCVGPRFTHTEPLSCCFGSRRGGRNPCRWRHKVVRGLFLWHALVLLAVACQGGEWGDSPSPRTGSQHVCLRGSLHLYVLCGRPPVPVAVNESDDAELGEPGPKLLKGLFVCVWTPFLPPPRGHTTKAHHSAMGLEANKHNCEPD